MLRPLKCDMTKECGEPITHLDERGFIYCARHGKQRQMSMRCRKLNEKELAFIKEEKPLASYEGVEHV